MTEDCALRAAQTSASERSMFYTTLRQYLLLLTLRVHSSSQNKSALQMFGSTIFHEYNNNSRPVNKLT